MKKNKNKKPSQKLNVVLRNDGRMLLKVLKTTPSLFITLVISNALGGLSSAAGTYFTYLLLNSLDEQKEFSEILPILIAMAVFWTVYFIYVSWYRHYYERVIRRKLFLKLQTELFEKAIGLDVSCYDDPEFYNDFVWAMDNAGGEATGLLDDFAALIRTLITSGTLFGLLITIDPIIAAVIMVSSVISVISFHIGNRLSFEQEKEMNPLWRTRRYINRIFYLPDYAKEVRSGKISEVLIDKMNENTGKIVEMRRKYGKKYFVIYDLLGGVLGNITNMGVVVYMFIKLLNGEVLAGAFAASVGVIWNLRWNISSFIEGVMKFPKHSLFLEKYYGFLNYVSRTKSGTEQVPHFESLELRNVSFTYDFSDHPKYEYHDEDYKPPENTHRVDALKNVSMSLKKGEKIAIVGYNGAGKTTLIKLLMRLYDPSDGQVLMNGKDIREYNLEEYKSRIGTVFQDYKMFSATIAENVVNGEYDPENDRETVIKALDAAGFGEKLSELENGIDTMLTREFDEKGTNLSGGEQQKVAIARVFAKPFELIIMDEPSSALDPIAEYNLNQAILQYAADKTVIFISHRLSTTRMADRIYMFDSGVLSEYGSHEELMELNGKYAEMFNLQAENYRKKS